MFFAVLFIRLYYRAGGPPEMKPVGEIEFVNGTAAMSESGQFGKSRLCAGIVGHADLTLGSHVEPVLLALMRAAAAPLEKIGPH